MRWIRNRAETVRTGADDVDVGVGELVAGLGGARVDGGARFRHDRVLHRGRLEETVADQPIEERLGLATRRPVAQRQCRAPETADDVSERFGGRLVVRALAEANVQCLGVQDGAVGGHGGALAAVLETWTGAMRTG